LNNHQEPHRLIYGYGRKASARSTAKRRNGRTESANIRVISGRSGNYEGKGTTVIVHEVNPMIKMKFTRKRLIFAVALLPFLLLSAQAFGQSAGVSGTVTDATGAVLPGTIVTATNNDTGVKTTATSNNAGIFNFASLAPGTYMVSSEFPGFQTLKKTDIKLEVGARLRVNFEMQVSGIATRVEVTTSAADLLLESTASTGTVMNDKVAKDLPLIGNDVMQLVNVMGGVVKAENTVYGGAQQTFAGIMANDINITRDGISVNDARYSSGIVSPARMNPEMIGEFKLVLTPVDAEMGRGAGQVQVLTKSGGNEYHGSGIWSNINTGMDAKEWNDNRLDLEPMWKNVNQYTISAGGPIIKNKTFFFASWDQNIARKREPIRSNVLTPCARKGLYRYFPGWTPAPYDAVTSRGYNSQSRASVNVDGTPLKPADNANGTPYTVVPGGTAYGMHWGSVLGPLTPEANALIAADPLNCSQYNIAVGSTNGISGASWNTYRKAYDPSGYTERFSGLMPLPNNYLDGDGLNTADLLWTRTTHGEDTVYGSGMDSARKSITVKIDHNLNQRHRLSGTYSYEKSSADGEDEPTWPPPNGYGGYVDRQPQTVTATLTSTLKPTLLNEFRFGIAYNMNRTGTPLDNPTTGRDMAGLLQTLLPTDSWSDWKGLPVLVAPGNGTSRFNPQESNPYGGRFQSPGTWGSNDWRYTYSDTLTWTKGSHSFKFGGDMRLTKAQSQMNGVVGAADDPIWLPYAFGGSATNAPPSGIGTANESFPGMVGSDAGAYASGTYSQIYGLMDYIAGSVRDVRQWYFAKDNTATAWSDPATTEGQVRHMRMKQREFSFFLKDDWKVNSDLTLNLGVRYEYYGVPWMLDGMTVGVVGGAQNLFGGQSGGFEEWLRGVPSFNPNNLAEQHFIGPGSPNPDEMLFNKDLNNFGPAIGFAWQLPWFGKGKTTLRGGYQVNYSQISRLDPYNGFMNIAASQPGLIYPHTYGGDSTHPYLDLAHMQDYTPTSRFWDGSVEPLATRPLTDGTQTAAVYDPNVRSPYIQSLTLALTRQIGSSLTVDVRYIGTLSRKQIGTINLNTNNWVNNGLKEAFDAARAGGESALLDQLMPAFSFWFAGSGAAQLRTHYLTSTSLAVGDYNAIASTLATTNGLYPAASTVQGELIRRSGLGENFIWTNRQFSAANWNTNRNHTNYHSMQAQVTLRPTHGLNFQATYTWSRNLGDRGDNTDPLNPQLDYGILSSSRSHTLTTYGTYNVPIGKLRDSIAWVKKVAEGWQLSWVSSATSGLPYSVTTVPSMYGGSGVDLVNPALFNAKDGHVTWDPSFRNGLYFGDTYTFVNDPQCDGVAASLQTTCRTNLQALALASDPSQIVFQHAQAGVRGNFDSNTLTGPGRWSLDMAISKNIVIKEGKRINFRVDVNNIFNHPTPSGSAPSSYDQRTYSAGAPNANLGPIYTPFGSIASTDPFGYIGYKVSHRVFSVKLRASF
jgi:hypothetical protein